MKPAPIPMHDLPPLLHWNYLTIRPTRAGLQIT